MEWLKVLTPVIVAIITLLGGWLVGMRIADRWDHVKKQRDLDLAALAEFYRVYGEFVAVWKAWAAVKDQRLEIKVSDDTPWKLLERAVAVEGSLEALVVKIAAERELTEKDIDVLAGLRQAYKSLRKEIRADAPAMWLRGNNPQYDALRGCATYVNKLLSKPPPKIPPNERTASDTFKRIADTGAYKDVWPEKVASYGLLAATTQRESDY